MGMTSSITNMWGSAKTHTIHPEHFEIFHAPSEGAYNHHPQITSYKGKWYATWSNGFRDEDQLGQRMLLATSDDGGETWSETRPLIDRLPGENEYGVVTAEGIYTHKGKMVAYYGYYDITDNGVVQYYTSGGNRSLAQQDENYHINVHTGIMISEDAGATWLGPVNTINNFVPNLCPTPTSSGRLILPGNFSFPFTDDPYGIQNWTSAAVPDLPDNFADDPEGHVKIMKHRRNKIHVCEGSFFQTDDAVIHMMLRTSDAQVLAVSESHDNGKSWSEPVLTQYTDCHCRFHFGRLPDGRFFGLSCPQPNSQRTPLVLATSQDGIIFDTHYVLGAEESFPPRIPGIHKSGRYGYPSFHLMDDTMFVIYSINKEDIALCRFPLSALI
jgi:Neuraminidase (sialidase)